MKSLAFLTLVSCTNLIHSEEPMQPFEILKQLENCYHAMQPAVENNEEAFVWLSDIPHPLFNAVMHLSSQNVSARIESLLETIPAENPISFWVHRENKAEGFDRKLKELGFSPVITCSVMGWPVKPTATLPYDIRPADTETFYQIIADIFHFDEIVKSKYEILMGKIKTESYVIYLDGKAVGTGTLFPNGETGGIFNISTLPAYERRGCAGAMMRHLMDRAATLKLKQLVLLSSPSAKSLYLGLEFKNAFDVDIYAR